MNVQLKKKPDSTYDSWIIPFSSDETLKISLPQSIGKTAQLLLKNREKFKKCGDLRSASIPEGDKLTHVILVHLGTSEENTIKEIALALAKALKHAKKLESTATAVFLDNSPDISHNTEILKKLLEQPGLVYYSFQHYKSKPEKTLETTIDFITETEGFEPILEEACHCWESTGLARDYVNHPAMYMTPAKLAEEALKVGQECGLDVQVFEQKEIEALGMHTFLAVARGSGDAPRLIVLRYHGGEAGGQPIALVGKGIMFDSGGYSIKSNMENMHNDMAGAAAAIGAIRSIAKQKLKVNVVSVIAACKNMISCKAYVPGDILTSMNGKTIEMLNADAEGRLTLADAVTYAIRKENARAVIDIATLTGAAVTAVGTKTSAILSNDNALCGIVENAAKLAGEKVWRLDADKELLPSLKSHVADLKNISTRTAGGGTITAGLFIQEFTEEKPWVHIDMASVAWQGEETPNCPKGATGYGASLLYHAVKLAAGQ